VIVAALLFATTEDISLEAHWRSRASLETHWIGGNKWEIEVIPDPEPESTINVEIRRNGAVKLKLNRDDFCGDLLQAGRGWYPVGYPVFVISGHTGCSHGELTRFYAVQGGEVREMFEIYGEFGGPVFRDLDGDGKQEWIFDNFECPAFMQDTPPAFLVYRQEGYRVKFWKQLPNPNGIELPSPAVRCF
jgi:hypothetical protein